VSKLETQLAEARVRNRARLAHVLDHQDEIVNAAEPRVRSYISFAEVYEAYKVHDGKCAICGTGKVGRNHALDHDHRTMKIRGILCLSCNVGLGHFKDDPDLLRKAIDYLAKANKEGDIRPAAAA
jgi:hypothetical protein